MILINHHMIQKFVKRINRVWGSHLDVTSFIAFIAVLICLVQFLLYLFLCPKTIFCRLPNLRAEHLKRHQSSVRYEKLPFIYVITPTYTRYVQKAELTRLSHTFMLVPNLHWIIVEDSDWSTDVVSKLVRRLKNEFDFHTITHLRAKTPDNFKRKQGEPSWKYPKGIWQRNKALDWINENLIELDRDGIIYFADDDNTYDLELFDQMRYTRKVSVWPVGFVGGLLVERPIIRSKSIESFNSMWERDRPFPIDMAGFAISLNLFINHLDARFSAEQRIGYVESHFLGQLIQSWNELEPRADECSKILVWHTQAQPPRLHEERKLKEPSHGDMEL